MYGLKMRLFIAASFIVYNYQSCLTEDMGENYKASTENMTKPFPHVH